jgi:hypothetical protein
MSSILCSSGDIPPDMHRNCLFMIAATGRCAEGLEACVVHALGVLVLALCLEGEVVGEVMTPVVSAEEEERVRVLDLKGPKVE